mmetsp:Transcript_52358/g.102489  ORF Transcript_52358/g.102489 Transcript_52358/m.102489 type:complete len:151 (+) Transcript_52358:142-594(+)
MGGRMAPSSSRLLSPSPSALERMHDNWRGAIEGGRESVVLAINSILPIRTYLLPSVRALEKKRKERKGRQQRSEGVEGSGLKRADRPKAIRLPSGSQYWPSFPESSPAAQAWHLPLSLRSPLVSTSCVPPLSLLFNVDPSFYLSTIEASR